MTRDGLEANRRIGILESGGGVRVGPVHYNTPAEIDGVIEGLHEALRET